MRKRSFLVLVIALILFLGSMENIALARVVNDFSGSFSNEEKRGSIKLSSEEKKYISEIKNQSISLIYDTEISYHYTKPILNVMEEDLGIKFQAIKNESWKDALEDIKNEKYDLLTGVTYTKEREKDFYFTSSIINEYRIGLTNKNNPIIDINQVQNKKVGFLKDDIYEKFSRSIIKEDTEKKFYNSSEEAIKALQNEEINIFITGDNAKTFAIDNEDIQVEFTFQDRPTSTTIVTSKQEIKPLIDIINKYLDSDYGEELRKVVSDSYTEKLYDKMKDYINEKYPDNSSIQNIEILLTGNDFPFSYMDKDGYTGTDIEVLNLFKKITGIDYKLNLISDGDKEKSLLEFNDNKYDILIGNTIIGKKSIYENLIPSKGLKTNSNIVSVINTLSTQSTLKNQSGTIGIVKDVFEFVTQPLIDDEYVQFDSSKEAIKALKNHDVDMVLMQKSILDYEKFINNDDSIMQSDFIDISYENNFFLHKNNTTLNEIINEAIRLYLVLDPVSGNENWINKVSEYQSKYYELHYQAEKKNVVIITLLFIVLAISIVFLIYRYKVKTKKLLEESKIDSLTGLLNKNSYNGECLKLINKNRDLYGIFVFIDLDNFKKINDSYGHIFGDKYLYKFSKHLKKANNDSSISFRIAGDEFGMLIMGFKDLEAVKEHTKTWTLKRKVEISLPNGQGRIPIKYSVGYSIFNYDAVNIDRLKEYADFAMYKAKENKKYNINIKRFKLKEYLDEKEKQKRHLEVANIIENNKLEVKFQDIYDMRNDCLYGYEGLTRVQSDKSFNIEDLIKVAYKFNYIETLDSLMVVNTMSRFKINKKLFINIEAISKEVVINQINNIIDNASSFNIEKENIVLEICERDELTIECMDEILALKKKFGFLIAIDDFGTGYSNFSMLFYLRPDILKLDKSLIRGIDKEPFKESYVKSIISFLKKEHIKILCEGIETEEEFRRLKEIGVDLAQGYYINRPHKL